jgi:hypothetical protein
VNRRRVRAAWLTVAQRAGEWRLKVTSVLTDDAELADNAELGDDAQRVGWVQHGRQWRKGRVDATVMAHRVVKHSDHPIP